jgi:hypothetical protein
MICDKKQSGHNGTCGSTSDNTSGSNSSDGSCDSDPSSGSRDGCLSLASDFSDISIVVMMGNGG